MAFEAVLIFETALPIPFTVADGTAIPKGTLLKLTDPMTAIIVSGDGDAFAGVAAEAKIASDGRTKLPVYRQGIFRMFAGGSITAGNAIQVEGTTANEVVIAATGKDGAEIIGTALEDVTAQQSFLMELNIGAGSPSA